MLGWRDSSFTPVLLFSLIFFSPSFDTNKGSIFPFERDDILEYLLICFSHLTPNFRNNMISSILAFIFWPITVVAQLWPTVTHPFSMEGVTRKAPLDFNWGGESLFLKMCSTLSNENVVPVLHFLLCCILYLLIYSAPLACDPQTTEDSLAQ